MLSTQHGMQEQGQNPEKVTLYIIVVGEENYGNGRGQQVKTLCDRTNHTLDHIGLVVRLRHYMQVIVNNGITYEAEKPSNNPGNNAWL